MAWSSLSKTHQHQEALSTWNNNVLQWVHHDQNFQAYQNQEALAAHLISHLFQQGLFSSWPPLFKPGAPAAGRCAPGFLKLFLCGRLYACVCVFVCVCPPPRLLITSGVMWHDMDLIRLVKQVLQLYMATVVVIINGRGLRIGTRRRHKPHKS